MTEHSMWNTVRPAMWGLDPVRVENRAEAGTPDVNYTLGWIELKQVDRYPRPGAKLFIDHYTPQQRTWAVRRAAAGGRVYLFLKVEQEWILLDGVVAAEKLNKSTMEELRCVAIKVWKRKLDKKEFRKLIIE